MNPGAVVSVVSALAGVLGLVALLTLVMKRLGHVSASAPSERIEVLARSPLAPRQGVATVRVRGATLLVSYGDGGVRLLTELDDDVTDEVPAADPGLGAAESPSPDRFRSILSAAGRRVAGLKAVGLVLAMAVVTSAPLTAQSPGAGAAATSVGTATAADRAGQVAEARGPQARFNLDLGTGADDDGLQLSGTVGTVLFVGFLTLIPTLLLLMTSFTRILIVLHLLKQALGAQSAPPAHLLSAFALLLTGFVMAPTLTQVNETALQPWMNGEIDELVMLETAAVPMREFMLSQTREDDLAAFVEMREGPRPETIDDVSTIAIVSAFVTSELTSAFQMGFALFLPFVVIDLVVAAVLMSMGMFMLPPVMVSLPFKLLLFVLVDGWTLIVGSLVQSF